MIAVLGHFDRFMLASADFFIIPSAHLASRLDLGAHQWQLSLPPLQNFLFQSFITTVALSKAWRNTWHKKNSLSLSQTLSRHAMGNSYSHHTTLGGGFLRSWCFPGVWTPPSLSTQCSSKSFYCSSLSWYLVSDISQGTEPILWEAHQYLTLLYLPTPPPPLQSGKHNWKKKRWLTSRLTLLKLRNEALTSLFCVLL